MSQLFDYVKGLCENAKSASYAFGALSGEQRNKLLLDCADALAEEKDAILKANALDVAAAESNGIKKSMVDRLLLTPERIDAIADSVRDVAALPDVCGRGESWETPNGLRITKQRVPLGVVGMIYESRPNVTCDAATLCIKTSNVCVLRCGKEALGTSRVIAETFRKTLEKNGYDPNAVTLIDSPSREGSEALMKMRGLVDVLIPRGGKGLIKSVTENSSVPVIETGAGNCHLYVDRSADMEKAVRIAVNAKTSRPSVCNAIETILVHRSVADEFLPRAFSAMKKWNVEFRGDPGCVSVLGCSEATEEDYATEYNDYIVAVKIVDGVEEAVDHINRYGTGHSECIVTEDIGSADYFRKRVDAACVYVNASTRFTDGGCFGYGAEIGISTQKLHARGPMGLMQLTTEKYLIDGDGQIRE